MKTMRITLILLLVLISGAAPVADPEALMRSGDAAAARGDFEAAVAYFSQALERTTDPAPAAFNLAVARLHLASTGSAAERNKELREAELLFASFTSEGYPDPRRRAQALYGLGVCRLQRAETGDLAAARSAIGCLRQCLEDPTIEPSLRADVRNNLARACLLAWQLTPPPQQGEQQDPPDEGPDKPPQKDPNAPGNKSSSTNNPEKKPGEAVAVPPDGGEPRDTSARNPHGRTGPPTIPDNTEPTPLTAGDAAIYLQKAARALRADREQQRRQQAASPGRPGVRDW